MPRMGQTLIYFALFITYKIEQWVSCILFLNFFITCLSIIILAFYLFFSKLFNCKTNSFVKIIIFWACFILGFMDKIKRPSHPKCKSIHLHSGQTIQNYSKISFMGAKNSQSWHQRFWHLWVPSEHPSYTSHSHSSASSRFL